MRVVLTGRCNLDGMFIERSEVCRRAGNVGISVGPTVSRSTDYLVASRTDTAKCTRAAQAGVTTIDYFEFYGMIHARESADRGSPMTPDHDLDDQAAGRVRPITGPNGGRMSSRGELMARATGSRHMTGAENRAEARKERRAAARKAKADFYIKEKEPTVPRPHRMLDL